jgi:hypothetical protein
VKILFVILLVFLFSCSPQKRLNRLVKKYPELVKTDTIMVRDTIRDTINVTTELVKLDTIFSLNEIHDTITITKDNLTIRYYHDTIHDSIYISGECDTIFVKVPYERIVEYKVPCDKVIVKKGISWWYWFIIIMLILGILYLVKKR